MHLLLVTFIYLLMGCSHQTAISDPKLSRFWAGQALPDQTLLEAKQKWPLDTSLLDMQEAVDLLRQSDLQAGNIKRAKTYLENAFNTFDDLKEPANFSKAFTSDNQTPYRGRPYERMLSAILLALLDAADDRCDMAVPALKAAEFLDARWQPFMFGTDAPLIYALMLRCSSDQSRAKDGLYRSLRMQLMLEPFLKELAAYASQAPKSLAMKAAIIVADVGLASALLIADQNASTDDIFKTATTESMLFLQRALKENEAPYTDILKPIMSKTPEHEVEQAFSLIWQNIHTGDLLKEVKHYQHQIEKAAQAPNMLIYFNGEGPTLKRTGSYGEIAQIVPSSLEDAKAGIGEIQQEIDVPCGVSNQHKNLIIALCKQPHTHIKGDFRGLRLWSSSFQATTTVGRRFEQILRGRAQFRMGTETAALIGGYTALALLDASSSMRGKGAAEMQTAALVIGAIAGAAWLAGRATNPEADIRHVQHHFESAYILLPLP